MLSILKVIFLIIISSCNIQKKGKYCCCFSKNQDNKEKKLEKEERQKLINKEENINSKEDIKQELYKPGFCESILNRIIIKFELDRENELPWDDQLIPEEIKQSPRLFIGER